MSERTQDGASAPREIVQVTLDGAEEIAAAMALSCAGYKALEFFICAHTGHKAQAERALNEACNMLDRATDVIKPEAFLAVHRKLHLAGNAAADESAN